MTNQESKGGIKEAQKYIYINDPLAQSGYVKKEKSNFIKAWKQMGRQAITIKN